MRYLKYAVMLGFLVAVAGAGTANAQVRFGVGVGVGPVYGGPAYVGPAPVCAYGYYDAPPLCMRALRLLRA